MAIDPMFIRSSEVDRGRVEALLKQGFEEGRLSQFEFSERLEQVHTSVNYHDLVQLVEDLPYDHAFLLPLQQQMPSATVPSEAERPIRRSRSRSVLIAFFAFFILAGAIPPLGGLFVVASLVFLFVALPRSRRRRMYRERDYYGRYRTW